ncbi:MAG: Polypeptide-transport-associated domain protein FtsQ-type [Chlorobi bacterium]|nr:Polypeptide-transport-associated domain protein FtsQ-type [Chlorobiota bacterium]
MTRADQEQARRFAANVSTWLLVIAGVAGLVMVANKWARHEEVRSIRIVGRKILDSAEIMKQAALPDSVPLGKLDLTAIETRIVAHPFISHAAVYRGENGTLVVEIAERDPVAVTFAGGSPLYLDSTGVQLPYRFSSAAFDLPVIGGVMDAPAADSTRRGIPAAARAQARVQSARNDSLRIREALGVLATLRSYEQGLYRQISEIRREANGEYTFLTADGVVPVKVGYPPDISGRLRKLDIFMTTVLAARGVDQAASIDLRWKGQVVVRWREAARTSA